MNEAMPSIATLERYVNGEMSDAEAGKLENQIAEDPMLADVIEGLKMIRADSGHAARMGRLRKRVSVGLANMPSVESSVSRRKSRVRPVPQYLIYTAVAAGFALLLVFVGVLKEREADHDNSAISEHISSADNAPDLSTKIQESIPAVSDTPSQEYTLPPASPPPSRVPQFTPVPQEPSLPAASVSSYDEDRVSESPAADNDLIAPSPDVESDPKSYPAAAPRMQEESPGQPASESFDEISNQVLQEESELVRQRTSEIEAEERQYLQPTRPSPTSEIGFQRENIPQQSRADRLEGSLSKALVMADLLELAKASYERDQPDSAIAYLDEVLLSEPGNVTASYYKGIALMSKEAYKDAIALLETAASIDESPLQVEAEYQLARATLLAGKNRKARNLLSEIVAREGKYAAEASTLLENMD